MLARHSDHSHSVAYKKMEANMKRESIRQADIDKEISRARGDALYKRQHDKDIEHAVQDARDSDDAGVEVKSASGVLID